MPTLLLLNGFRFFFYSNENTEPIHVHVKKGDATGKIWLESEMVRPFVQQRCCFHPFDPPAFAIDPFPFSSVTAFYFCRVLPSYKSQLLIVSGLYCTTASHFYWICCWSNRQHFYIFERWQKLVDRIPTMCYCAPQVVFMFVIDQWGQSRFASFLIHPERLQSSFLLY